MVGGFIGENVGILYDTLFESETNNIPGLILLTDFEKAFDSISLQFIHKTLKYFGFSPSVRRWVSTFYNNATAYILQNGHLSKPLISYLFILGVEILGILVWTNPLFKGIDIGGF